MPKHFHSTVNYRRTWKFHNQCVTYCKRYELLFGQFSNLIFPSNDHTTSGYQTRPVKRVSATCNLYIAADGASNMRSCNRIQILPVEKKRNRSLRILPNAMTYRR